MNIEINKEKLIEAILFTERFTSKHITLPILANILFSFKDKICTVRSTNLDVGIEFSFGLKKEVSPTEFVVSPQALRSFVSNVVDKELIFEFNESTLKVSSKNAEVVLMTQSPDDFPNIPKLTEGDVVVVGANLFKEGITAVSYSASLSTIKPELSSIFIYPDQEELVFVATDSFRLAEKKVKVSKKNIKESILLPFKNAIEIAKIFDNYSGDIELTITKNQVVFKTEDIYISSRAVDGVFPDYKQIIPKSFVSEIILFKEDLLKALKLTGSFLDKFQQIICTFSPQEKNINIKTKGGTEGDVSQNVSISGSGEQISITFNHKYILDCLQSIKGEQVCFKLVGSNKPVIITEASQKSFIYLVMPMNR